MRESDRWVMEIPRRFDRHPGPPEAVRARVLAEIEKTKAKAMPLRHRLILVILALPGAGALVVLGRLAIFGSSPLRVDLPALPFGQLIIELLYFSALGIAAAVVAVRPGRRGLGSPARALAATSLTVAPLYALVALSWPMTCAISEAHASRLHPWGLPCLSVATLVGAITLSLLTYSLRHTVPSAARLRGAALGAASGAWAGLILVLHCSASAPAHIVVGHVLPVAAFVALGTLIAPIFLRP